MLDLFDAHSVVYALAGLAALGGALLVFSLPLGLGTIDPLVTTKARP